MNNAGMRCEGIQLAGNSIVKARADGNQQIALLDGQIRRFGAVHAQHAEIARIAGIRRTQTFQRRNGRYTRLLNELTQRRYRLRNADAAADI